MKSHQKGFTLIEAIVAIAILTVISAILANLIFLSFNIRNTNQERQESLKITSSIMDEIKAYQSVWENSYGLKTWLADHGFTAVGTDSYQTIKNGIQSTAYETTITISNPGVDGVFRIILSTKSPRVSDMTLVTYFRG